MIKTKMSAKSKLSSGRKAKSARPVARKASASKSVTRPAAPRKRSITAMIAKQVKSFGKSAARAVK